MHCLSAVIVLTHIFQLKIVGMDLTFQAGREDPIQRRSTPLNAKLNDGCIGRVFALIICRRVPQLDNVITACRYDICNGLLFVPFHCDEICRDE